MSTMRTLIDIINESVHEDEEELDEGFPEFLKSREDALEKSKSERAAKSLTAPKKDNKTTKS